MSGFEFSADVVDFLTEVINVGVGRASGTLSELLGQHIELSIPDLRFSNLEAATAEMRADGATKYVVVVQAIHGDFDAVGVLGFPLVKGKTLVDTLMGGGEGGSEFNLVEIEAIQEIGNMVINAVGAAISDMLGLRLDYKLPQTHFLSSPIPLDQLRDAASLYCLASTIFFVKGVEIEGRISLVFPMTTAEMIADRMAEILA